MDTAAPELDELVAALSVAHEVVVLCAARDGVEQMVDVLGSRESIHAVHVLAHGAGQEFRLGSTVMSEQVLQKFGARLQAHARDLHPVGKLLLYRLFRRS